jgi:predicted RNA-binding protein with RPS1 domain
VPKSEIATRNLNNLDRYIGQSIDVKVLEVDREKGRVLLSERKVAEEKRIAERAQTLSTLTIGIVLPGTVARVTDFGAFVDIGGVDGLLHVSDMSWERIEKPAEFLKVGDELILDDFEHEQNLIINEGGKKVLITGCAHNGIVNIIEHFFDKEGRMPDYVIGGFHLTNPTTKVPEDEEVLRKIAAFFLDTKAMYYTGHCTGADAYKYLKNIMKDRIGYIATGKQLVI